MRRHINTYLSFSLLALSILLWAGVGYFALVISERAAYRASHAIALEAEVEKQDTALHLHSLLRETKIDRSRLEELTNPDIIEILDAVEGAGKSAGVEVTVGRALGSASTENASDVRSATLALEAAGTFSSVSRLVALLESLSIPSEVREVRLERLEGASAGAPWRMIAEIEFLTTADISS